jgi:hypothetical protein
MDDEADTVRLTYAAAQDRQADLARSAFRRYLRTAKAGPVAVDDEWREVVNDGCGRTTPITLRVTAVEGGTEVGESTGFAFERER